MGTVSTAIVDATSGSLIDANRLLRVGFAVMRNICVPGASATAVLRTLIFRSRSRGRWLGDDDVSKVRLDGVDGSSVPHRPGTRAPSRMPTLAPMPRTVIPADGALEELHL